MNEPAVTVPISALQHYLYCDRQCALIHVERVWQENRHTAEGRVMHERADRPGHEQRRGVRTAMALPLNHEVLGLSGYADIVEFEKPEVGGRVRPIEYKRGRPKSHRADEVQLCAQALCLEDMLDCEIVEGALFYGQTKRRKEVAFDATLRALTTDAIEAVQTLIQVGATPRAVYESRKCDRCSLIELCHPQADYAVTLWLEEQLAQE